MKYLITGATGNVGSKVVDILLQSGQRPCVFVRDAQKARLRFADRVDVFSGDLADVEGILGRKPIAFDQWLIENAEAFRSFRVIVLTRATTIASLSDLYRLRDGRQNEMDLYSFDFVGLGMHGDDAGLKGKLSGRAFHQIGILRGSCPRRKLDFHIRVPASPFVKTENQVVVAFRFFHGG